MLKGCTVALKTDPEPVEHLKLSTTKIPNRFPGYGMLSRFCAVLLDSKRSPRTDPLILHRGDRDGNDIVGPFGVSPEHAADGLTVQGLYSLAV